MDVERVGASHILAHLTNGLQERQPLNVTHGAADFDDQHIRLRHTRGQPNAPLDLVGHMRDNLNGAAQIVAAPLLAQYCSVNLSTGNVAQFGEIDVDEAFIVTEVQVGLSAVIGDEDLAVLIGRHGAGVDVQIWVQFHGRHAHPARLENCA